MKSLLGPQMIPSRRHDVPVLQDRAQLVLNLQRFVQRQFKVTTVLKKSDLGPFFSHLGPMQQPHGHRIKIQSLGNWFPFMTVVVFPFYDLLPSVINGEARFA